MPDYTFTVNLSTVRELKDKPPYLMSSGDTFSDDQQYANARTTWIPNNFLHNRQLNHGDTFTASGAQAIYLRDNFTSGEYKFLDYE